MNRPAGAEAVVSATMVRDLEQRVARGGPSGVDIARLLVGGGEMGAMMRSLDWAATPVGPPEAWPQSLRTAVSILLDSRFPMLALWGPELVQFYNDAFRPILGANKHPAALGQRARDCWSEIWDVISPLFDGVMARGQATFAEDLLFFLDRNGYLEETYFTFCYSAIRGESQAPGGVLVTCVETTPHVVGERRLRALRELAARAAEAATAEEACAAAACTLAGSPNDAPFALVYLLDPGENGRQRARLVGAAALEPGSAAAPVEVELRPDAVAPDDPWLLAAAAATDRAATLDDLGGRFGPLPGGPWPESPRRALVLPIRQPGTTVPAGLLVVGLSPRLPLDEDYRGFLDLAAGHIATAVANARVRESERRRAEALAELDRAKTAFFSNVSHEFRTPLTLLLGPAEDALADAAEPVQRERLELVRRNGQRLLRLVNTLLDFSRIEAGRVDASFERLDLPASTAEVASSFRSAFDRAGLALEVDCPPLPPGVEAYVDRDMWEKVVLNLLSNALKFTFAGGVRVRVRASPDGPIELTVADTGVGIAADELPRVFERFHQVQGVRGRSQEGSGIGLALVQELVKVHDGSVRVESEPGRGSTFTVALPVGRAHLPADRIDRPRALVSSAIGAQPFVEEALGWLPAEGAHDGQALDEPGADASRATARSAPAGEDAPRVLVVDDNADMRGYVRRLLSSTYRVEAVGDAAAALAAAARARPDLVVSDVMLPGIDGMGLLRALRADPATERVPVVLLSARAGEEARVEGLRAGADDYLAKPFSARELLARVEAHIAISRARGEADAQRARLFDAERRAREAAERVQRHLAVRDAVGAVLAGASLEDGPPRLLDEICRGFGWDWGAFWEVDADDAALVSVARWVRPSLAAAAFAAATASTAFVRGHGLPGRVWASGRPTWIADVQRNARFTRRAAAAAAGLHGAVALPIRSGGRVVAVMELLSREVRPREPDVLATLAAIGAKVGQFVERRRAEEALRQSEARFRELFDDAPVGYQELDAEGRFVRVNRALCRMLGYAEGELLGRRIWDFEWAAGEPPEETRRKFVEKMATGHGWTSVERVRVRKDGTLLPVWVDDQLVHDASGRVVGLRSAQVDISARKAAEAERDRLFAAERAARLEAEAAVRAREEFVATVSHDLGNPLAAIKGHVQLLRRRAGRGDAIAPAQLDARLATVEGAAADMDRLIGDLLDAARLQSGRPLDLRRQRADLVALARGCLGAYEQSSDRHAFRFEASVPAAVGEWDVARVQRVIANLLSNAVKYSPEGGEVLVAVEVADDQAVLTVRDHGLGIPAADLPHVFERFRRGANVAAWIAGTGIGLAGAKEIVAQHGGAIRIDSAEGCGTTVVVRLPLAPQADG